MASFSPGVNTYGPTDPNGILVHAAAPRRIELVTLLSGQNLPAGRMIGKITTGGKYKEALAASADGSQLLSQCAFLMEACDASASDKQCLAIIAGDVDATKCSFGTGFTLGGVKEYLAHAGLHLHSSYSVAE